MTSTTAREVLEKREAALDACELTYAQEHNDAAWRAVEAARSLRDRGQLDLTLAEAREAAERKRAEAEELARIREAYDTATGEADPVAYVRAARPIVARAVKAMAEAEEHLAVLDAMTEAQNEAARFAGRLGPALGLREPASVSGEESARLLRVALEAGGHGKRIAEVLTPPGLKRLRECLSYGERGMLLGQEIRRAASDRGVPSGELGLDDLGVSAVERPDWKAPELPAWEAARTAMGLDVKAVQS